MYYRYWDPTYILVLIGAIIAMMASAKVKSTFQRFSRVRSHSGLTGAEAAARILNSAGIYDVTIERIAGDLTDHYDPRSRVLRLSNSVYNNTSVAAIGVAAHECGHAIQDEKNYAPLKLRGAFVPVANIGTKLALPIILIGAMLTFSQPMINFGIFLFSFGLIFQLITLPVEFNASRRALRILGDTGILYGDEVGQARKVLSAAALTYVAGVAASFLSLLRLVILFGGRDRD